jgi:hypothetical protein
MKRIAAQRSDAPVSKRLRLFNGDRMSRVEFNRRYESCPPNERFELVGGVVYATPRTTWTHGTTLATLNFVACLYQWRTPGVEGANHGSVFLGVWSEPQPDLTLRLLEECGGRSKVDADLYLNGPPELVGEVAYSSRAIDLHQKREDYERAGVLEYLVLCIEEQELRWFDFASGREIMPNRQGISRSLVFPGLWIDNRALLERNSTRVREVVEQGMASRAHAAFVRQLQAARRRST